jgi:hypothetical protein
MSLRLNGSTSGYTEIDAPAVAGSNTLVLPTGAGSAYQVVRNGATAGSLEFTDKIVSGTAQNSTSGTSIDFTGIPSWVKRVTVMFNGVSTSGSSNKLVQIGAGSIDSTGYVSSSMIFSTGGSNGNNATTGYIISSDLASFTITGHLIITLLGSNLWISSHSIGSGAAATGLIAVGGGNKTLSGTLDRVRITTVNGTDTFDAGSINILYE